MYLLHAFGRGNISACAENTLLNKMVSDDTEKHLRMRGEYQMLGITENTEEETSPHARRIQRHLVYRLLDYTIFSASFPTLFLSKTNVRPESSLIYLRFLPFLFTR